MKSSASMESTISSLHFLPPSPSLPLPHHHHHLSFSLPRLQQRTGSLQLPSYCCVCFALFKCHELCGLAAGQSGSVVAETQIYCLADETFKLVDCGGDETTTTGAPRSFGRVLSRSQDQHNAKGQLHRQTFTETLARSLTPQPQSIISRDQG